MRSLPNADSSWPSCSDWPASSSDTYYCINQKLLGTVDQRKYKVNLPLDILIILNLQPTLHRLVIRKLKYQVRQVYHNLYHTFEWIHDIALDRTLLLINVVHDCRQHWRFYLPHLCRAILFPNELIQPAQAPSQSWIKVVLDIVVSPWFKSMNTCPRNASTSISTCSLTYGESRITCSTLHPSMASCLPMGSSGCTNAICTAYLFATLSRIVILAFRKCSSSPTLQTIKPTSWLPNLPIL